VLSPDEVGRISEAVVAENHRRDRTGEKPLYLLYDQVYWMLTFGSARHELPIRLVPDMARYTIFVDGISKAFAATGVRVGWCVGPKAIIAAMKDILGHVGAWAPRAEQVAVAKFLGMQDEIDRYHEQMIRDLQLRLDLLHDGFEEMRNAGLPVRAISPQGAIYLSAQVRIPGKTNEEIRKFLLDRAGFAVVAFQAFGLKQDTGWFRLSAGAVSLDEIRAGLRRVRAALEAL